MLKFSSEFLDQAFKMNTGIDALVEKGEAKSQTEATEIYVDREKKQQKAVNPYVINASLPMFETLPWSEVTKEPDSGDAKYVYLGGSDLTVERFTFNSGPVSQEIFIKAGGPPNQMRQDVILLVPRGETGESSAVVELYICQKDGTEILQTQDWLSETGFDAILTRVNKSLDLRYQANS